MKGELERGERGRDCGRCGVVQMRKGEDGMDAIPLLKTTTIMKKGMRRRGDAFKVKDKVRPALLVLTLTDEQAALVAPKSNQLPHLHLGKRYYAEALDFMRTVEGALCVFFSSFPFSPCFHSHPHCFPLERKVADTFHLLIILAYFYGCAG